MQQDERVSARASACPAILTNHLPRSFVVSAAIALMTLAASCGQAPTTTATPAPAVTSLQTGATKVADPTWFQEAEGQAYVSPAWLQTLRAEWQQRQLAPDFQWRLLQNAGISAWAVRDPKLYLSLSPCQASADEFTARRALEQEHAAYNAFLDTQNGAVVHITHTVRLSDYDFEHKYFRIIWGGFGDDLYKWSYSGSGTTKMVMLAQMIAPRLLCGPQMQRGEREPLMYVLTHHIPATPPENYVIPPEEAEALSHRLGWTNDENRILTFTIDLVPTSGRVIDSRIPQTFVEFDLRHWALAFPDGTIVAQGP